MSLADCLDKDCPIELGVVKTNTNDFSNIIEKQARESTIIRNYKKNAKTPR